MVAEYVPSQPGDVGVNQTYIAGLGFLASNGNGSSLTNVSAAKLQSRTLASTAPRDSQMLAWNTSTSQWEPTDVASNQATKIDYVGGTNPVYKGVAAAGSATSAAAWRINKYTYDSSGNLTAITWAGGSTAYTNIWNNRVSLSYS